MRLAAPSQKRFRCVVLLHSADAASEIKKKGVAAWLDSQNYCEFCLSTGSICHILTRSRTKKKGRFGQPAVSMCVNRAALLPVGGDT